LHEKLNSADSETPGGSFMQKNALYSAPWGYLPGVYCTLGRLLHLSKIAAAGLSSLYGSELKHA
jgi:hypothetical protein